MDDLLVTSLDGGGYAIDGSAGTVATVSSRGRIDWLLRRQGDSGPFVKTMAKDTHLSSVQGLSFVLTFEVPETLADEVVITRDDQSAHLLLRAQASSRDGLFASTTTASLGVDDVSGRYVWEVETSLECLSAAPVDVEWIEYNNAYPGVAGKGFLHAEQKQYEATLVLDGRGRLTAFPHQHVMHYESKMAALDFADGTMSGFFGAGLEAPVVVLMESSLPPDWGICERYYDLHCAARPRGPIQPGEVLGFRYRLEYLDVAASEALLAQASFVHLTTADHDRHEWPRLELGLNEFMDPVAIDCVDDASAFRPSPPERVWDREEGRGTRGALRITNESNDIVTWTAAPSAQIPPGSLVRIAALLKTEAANGRGALVRLDYSTWTFEPAPHLRRERRFETTAVTGTTNGWVEISLSDLVVPPDHLDYELELSFILDGPGVAWLSELNIELMSLDEEPTYRTIEALTRR